MSALYCKAERPVLYSDLLGVLNIEIHISDISYIILDYLDLTLFQGTHHILYNQTSLLIKRIAENKHTSLGINYIQFSNFRCYALGSNPYELLNAILPQLPKRKKIYLSIDNLVSDNLLLLTKLLFTYYKHVKHRCTIN